MDKIMQVEISLAVIIAIAALALSFASFNYAKNKNNSADVKEVVRALTELKTEMRGVKDIIMGKPSLSEQVTVNTKMIDEHDKRITKLETK